MEHFLLCNESLVSFKILSEMTKFTCTCKGHQGRPKSLHRTPTKEQLQAPCSPAPVPHSRQAVKTVFWDTLLKWIWKSDHQKRRQCECQKYRNVKQPCCARLKKRIVRDKGQGNTIMEATPACQRRPAGSRKLRI